MTETFGYMAFRRHKTTGNVISFRSTGSRSKAEAWVARQEDQVSPQDPSENDGDETAEALAGRDLLLLIQRFNQSVSEYYNLSRLANSLMPIISAKIVEDRFVKFANEEMTKLFDDEDGLIFSYTSEQFESFIPVYKDYNNLTAGLSTLPSAVLLSLVATFDSYISDVVRILLGAREDRLKSSDKKISVQEIFEMSSFDDVVSKLIEDEVDSLMRGSHSDQIKYIENNFDIKIRESYKRWGDFVEIFERRNLSAHGKNIVSKVYVSNCKKSGNLSISVPIGTKLPIDGKYIENSTDILIEFGTKLMFVLWRKHYPIDDNKSYEYINEISYDLIVNKHSRVAAWLLDFALHEQNHKIDDRTRRMMIVNLANARKKCGEADEAEQILTKADWSASSDDFRICVAAVRGDVPQVVALMPLVVRSGSLDRSHFREWAAFDWVRGDPLFKSAFAEQFGEALTAELSEIGADTAEVGVEDGDRNALNGEADCVDADPSTLPAVAAEAGETRS